ncbi:MAG: cardiolipin synthase [Gemmatales bacterium]|nr:cardiolipin synthase [Gemmatales bacterium]MDW8176408.1 cardiolipin synthase [Gemmatales bacterium]
MSEFIAEHPLALVLSAIAIVHALSIVLGVPWVLYTKKESPSAPAWALTVIGVPVLGIILFALFGYNYVYRPIRKRRRLRLSAAARERSLPEHLQRGQARPRSSPTWNNLGQLAAQLGAFPVSYGNRVRFYHQTRDAFEDMFQAIDQAEHHIHLEYFIVRADMTGGRLLEKLIAKAQQGVEVRLLYDAVGSILLHTSFIRPLCKAGGRCEPFLTINPLRRRIQVNLRNHRKITVVDGRIAFTGGINIGDEYLGRDPRFGDWRDEHICVEGPAVACLQMVFAEDWQFASGEDLRGASYFPRCEPAGDAVVQIVNSGPDQAKNANRDLLFAAISMARKRLWIATPYFVPDPGLLDALRLAARVGAEVRILLPRVADHWLTHFATRAYVDELLDEGIRFYEYLPGMMHSKMMLVDDAWGYVGSVNLDYRSLRLNFEINCVLHSEAELQELRRAFEQDFARSELLDRAKFRQRGWQVRLAENFSRLFAPLL